MIDIEALDVAMEDKRQLVQTFLTAVIETGMRNGSEIRRMEWTHIDWRAGVIRIPKENTKTKKAREFPMSDHLRATLEAWPPVAGNPYVFATHDTRPKFRGKPYSYGYLHRLSREVLDRLQAAPGDGRVRAHDGRHTVVTRLVSGGLDPFAAMKLIGHATPAMLWRYHALTPKDRNEARRVLERDRKPAQRADRQPDDEVKSTSEKT